MCKTMFQEKIADRKFYISRIEELGITNKYLGYYYVVDILDKLLQDGMEFNSFYKDIYPKVAKKFGRAECTIERNIRNMITQIWNKGLKEKLTKFWTKEEKPSCFKFIYILKNYITSPLV